MFEHKYDDFMQFYGDVCEDPRDPIERKLAVMKKRNIAFGGKGSAPDPNPGMLASAEAAKTTAAAQERIAQNTLNFYKQQYEEFKPSIQQMLQTELSIMGENKDRAAEYAAYEKSTFRPVEQALVDQAKNYNTEAKREELARTASSDVAQAFGNVREQQNRQLAAAGIRPNSGRFAALNQTMLTQEALARAGAQNSARSMAEDKGTALMYDAAGLGRNLATNASTAYGVSLNAGQGGRQSAMAGGQIMGQGFQGAINANNGAIGGYGAAGNIYGQEFNARMQGYNAQQEAAGAFYGGLGQIGGMALGAYFKADGGEIRRGLRLADGAHVGPGPVRGPGGPVDDKIPAMLSNGEYVIPADTAAKIGKKNLDKLVAETHTPAAVQRQRKRKALKGKK
jgi:hypothetical protein